MLIKWVKLGIPRWAAKDLCHQHHSNSFPMNLQKVTTSRCTEQVNSLRSLTKWSHVNPGNAERAESPLRMSTYLSTEQVNFSPSSAKWSHVNPENAERAENLPRTSTYPSTEQVNFSPNLTKWSHVRPEKAETVRAKADSAEMVTVMIMIRLQVRLNLPTMTSWRATA